MEFQGIRQLRFTGPSGRLAGGPPPQQWAARSSSRPKHSSKLINRRIGELLELAAFIAASGPGPQCFTRPLLGDVLSEATQLEELLDAYGVRHNRRWYPLRQAAAALKLFSNASYILQHILHFLPTYRLLPLEEDFVTAATGALEFTCRILVASARNLLQTARDCGFRFRSKPLRRNASPTTCRTDAWPPTASATRRPPPRKRWCTWPRLS